MIDNVYTLAGEYALRTKENIFLTGKAGTGKTTFLHKLKSETNKQIAVVAPTGVAAINAGGTTIHSFFQIPFNPFIPTIAGKRDLMDKIKMRSQRRKLLQELELLVIDEISMVRCDTLDAIDTVLRQIRHQYHEPFGGVQVLFIGDLFQLSPVAVDEEWQLLSQYYSSPYFFHSQVINQNPPVQLELDKVFRQSNADFISLLNEIRNNCTTQAGFDLLMQRYQPGFKAKPSDNYITLTTHNYKADKINAEELEKVKGEKKIIKAKVEGDFSEKIYPTDADLVLKTGAKVMVIRNDSETPRRYYNGKTGIIKEFKESTILVHFPDDNQDIEIAPVDWENIRYRVNEQNNHIEEDIIGKFTQYPLRLAWAITIHKSQGLTFEKAIIDAGDAFSPGQVYVALSRCRNLEGMVLVSQIHNSILKNNTEILKYDLNRPPVDLLKNQLQNSKQNYIQHLISALFDYNRESGIIRRISKFYEENNASFNEETQEYLIGIQEKLNELTEIGQKFKKHLAEIMSQVPVNETYLAERMQAASGYFNDKIHDLQKHIADIRTSTDNRELAGEMTEALKFVYEHAELKNFIMKRVKFPFDSEAFLDIKTKFLVPTMSFNAYSGYQKSGKIKVNYPALYAKLVGLRNDLADEENIPVYLIAANKSLIEMADYLPLNEKDLMNIHGFGKNKVKKYGSMFLDAIQDFIFENNLSSRMHEKAPEKTSKGKKKTKKS